MSKQKRKEILKLEKQMQREPKIPVVIALAEKYVQVNEPHQAVAVLMEGIETFPENLTLQVICAKYMITYETDDVSRAESLIKQVLMQQPDNHLAQQLLEQIHTQVDTMHEVARESDTRELQAQQTIRVPLESQSDLPAYHQQLTNGFRLFHSGNIDDSLAIFQGILEEDPDNPDAQEGFRLAYTAKLKDQETEVRQEKLERKLEVVRRSVKFLDAMKSAARKKMEK